MFAGIRAWRTRTKVLVGLPASLVVVLLAFVAVRRVQYELADRWAHSWYDPPGAQALVRVKDLSAWSKLRSSPLVRLLLGHAPQGDLVHELATRLSGSDPLPSFVTEDRVLSVLGPDTDLVIYDIEDPERDFVAVVGLPFTYYLPLPFAGLVLDSVEVDGRTAYQREGLFVLPVGKSLLIASRKERLAEVLRASTPTPRGEAQDPESLGVAITASLFLERLPADGRIRTKVYEAMDSVPFREALHSIDIRSVACLGANLSTDGTTIVVQCDCPPGSKRMDPRVYSFYKQPPLPAALLDTLPSRAGALSTFRIDAKRDWAFLRSLADEPDRVNDGAELGEALKFLYANLGGMLDAFEKEGFAGRLFPHLGDTAAIVASQEKSKDILLGSAAVAMVIALKDEKEAIQVIDGFVGADLPEDQRKELRLQRYNDHIVRVIEQRNRWKEGLSFAYTFAGKSLVAGTSLPLVHATIDCLDGKGKALAQNPSMQAVRRMIPGDTLGNAFLWIDLSEMSRAVSSNAEKFAQERADRLIDRRALREEIERRERGRTPPEELDARVTELFEKRVAELTRVYAKEIEDTSSRLADLGTAGLSIEGQGGTVRLRAVIRLRTQ